MTVIDAHAIGGRRELDDLPGMQRALTSRCASSFAARCSTTAVGDLAERTADLVDPLEVARGDPRS